MSTKYFCDGCGCEVDEARRFAVLIMPKAELERGASMPVVDRDLCLSCETTLREQSDPARWRDKQPGDMPIKDVDKIDPVFDQRHIVPLPWQAPPAPTKDQIANAKLFRDSIDGLMQALGNENIASSQVRMAVSADRIHKISDMLSLAIGATAGTFRYPRRADRSKFGYAMYNGLRFDYE